MEAMIAFGQQLLTNTRKARIMDALRRFARQRPGLEFGNYGDVRLYRAEMRSITRDLRHFRELLRAVELRSISADDLIRAADRRLTIHEGDKVHIEYCTGQYWPTEYRPAACRVLASALWDYWRESMAPDSFGVLCCDDSWHYVSATSQRWPTRAEAEAYAATVAASRHPMIVEYFNGLRAGDAIRAEARRSLSRGVASRWFN